MMTTCLPYLLPPLSAAELPETCMAAPTSGDYLTEINVTSPTGARVLKRLSGIDAIAALWDVIEKNRARGWGSDLQFRFCSCPAAGGVIV
jgi:hypothetical protein